MKFDDLKAEARWVCYTADKVPINAKTGKAASSTNPDTWTTYDVALTAVARHGCAGVGMVFTGDGIVGIDLDDCLVKIDDDTYERNTYAKHLMNLVDAYTEVSPSGTGIHIIGLATIPKSIKTRLNGIGVEIYDRARYFTITGEMVEGCTTDIVSVQHIVDDVMDSLNDTPRDTLTTLPDATTPPDKWVEAVMRRRVDAAKRMVENAVDGDRHFARIKAGTLMGGYMAGAERIGHHLYTDDDIIDAIFDARKPSDDARRKERKAIADGIAYGRTQPIDIPAPPAVVPPKPMTMPAEEPALEIHFDAPRRDYHLTDIGNGLRFVDAVGDRLRYVAEWKAWTVWDGRRWAHGDDAAVMKLAHKVALSIYDDISKEDDEKKRKDLIKWAQQSESALRIDAMLKSARPYLTVSASQFDTHPHLLTVANGTVNLRTGELLPHRMSDMMTKMIDVDFDAHAQAPRWRRFLHTVMDERDDLVDYLQVATGYTITGSTDEHCLFFLYGVGANGKSTFLEALRHVIGEYYVTTSVEALLATDYTGGATPYVAGLQGMRYAMASEMPEGRRFNESLVKDITGGGTLTARHLYGQPFQFTPSHTLWISGNYRPRITGTDEGIWRRLRVIPFEVSIPEAQRRPMTDMLAEFHEERQGILAWMIHGAVRWYDWGLPKVDAVDRATMEYRGEEDLVARYIAERCVMHKDASVVKSKLFEDWQAWTQRENEKAAHSWRPRNLTEKLIRKGVTLGGMGRMQYMGIGLRSDREEIS